MAECHRRLLASLKAGVTPELEELATVTFLGEVTALGPVVDYQPGLLARWFAAPAPKRG